MEYHRWAKILTEWHLKTSKSIGKPTQRWADDIRKVAGKQWSRTARDRADIEGGLRPVVSQKRRLKRKKESKKTKVNEYHISKST